MAHRRGAHVRGHVEAQLECARGGGPGKSPRPSEKRPILIEDHTEHPRRHPASASPSPLPPHRHHLLWLLRRLSLVSPARTAHRARFPQAARHGAQRPQPRGRCREQGRLGVASLVDHARHGYRPLVGHERGLRRCRRGRHYLLGDDGGGLGELELRHGFGERFVHALWCAVF